MAHVIVNNNKLESYNPNETVDGLINYLTTKNINTAGHVITELIINEKNIDLNNPGEILLEKVESLKTLSVVTMSALELAFEAAESLPEYIDNINNQILNVTEHLRAGEEEEGNILFADAIETIELFIQLFSGIHNSFSKNLPYNYQKPESIFTLESKLLDIVKEIIIVKENNDVSMLCDLLEYELTANLVAWKSQVVPTLLQERENL